MSGKFSANPYYVEYESLLKTLHQLMAAGDGDTKEADAVRDDMDRPEQELSREELERLNGLSADLYMLQDEEIFEPPGEVAKTPQQLAAELEVAWRREDWERVLELLRQGPTPISRDRVAYMRALAYGKLGHADTELLFLEYAAHRNPKEPLYKSQLIELLSQWGRHEQAREYADTYIRDQASPPGLLIQSASVLLRAAKGMPRQSAAPLYERAVGVLHSVLPASSEMLPDAVALGYLTLGMCYQALGDPENACGAYNELLDRDPKNGIALVARGLLRLATDPEAAMTDFQSAADLDTPAVAPYVYLANRALRRGDFESCLKLCDKIPSRTQNPGILALALQWVAIARFELGKPYELVRRAFEAALTLDPFNQQIQHNLRLFEQLAEATPGAARRKTEWEASVLPDPAPLALTSAELPAVSMAA